MDIDNPIEIADNIFWVGTNIPDDQFQCHVYLIRNGDDSILIDPGSRITYNITKRKIEKLIELEQIKYLICHHQDPDIVGCIDYLLNDMGNTQPYLITHWRAWALLKHCNWNVKLYEIEEHGWKLKLDDRTLKFIFTPYMHFPGVFCTYDEKTKTLFSSDIFGGFTPEFELFAKSAEDYFEKLRPFHEHYIPSNAILNNGLDKIEKYQINLIAPQHGSIIRKKYIKPIIKKMRDLDCGLFRKFTNTRDVQKLSILNDILEEIIESIAYRERFFKVSHKFLNALGRFYNVDSIKAYVVDDDETAILEMDSNKTRPEIIEDKNKLRQMIEASSYIKNGAMFYQPSQVHAILGIEEPSYTFPIKDKVGKYYGICFITFGPCNIDSYKDLEILSKFELPISMAALSERSEFCTQNKIIQLHEEILRDPLTGYFNRRYINLLAEFEFKKAKRYKHPLSVLMIDIDHFKVINDTYGHKAGDLLLKHATSIIKKQIRSTDIPIRYGGEEFVIILPNTTKRNAYLLAERIRRSVEFNPINIDSQKIKCTVSIGVAEVDDAVNSIEDLINKADMMMYVAKQQGRNRIAY